MIDCVHSAGQSFRFTARRPLDIRQIREQIRLQVRCRDQVRKRDRHFSDPHTSALSERLSPKLVEEIKEGLIVLRPVKALFGMGARVIFQPGRKRHGARIILYPSQAARSLQRQAPRNILSLDRIAQFQRHHMAVTDTPSRGCLLRQFHAAQQIPQFLAPNAAPDRAHLLRIEREQARQIRDASRLDSALDIGADPRQIPQLQTKKLLRQILRTQHHQTIRLL
jgi:hypothetical protein